MEIIRVNDWGLSAVSAEPVDVLVCASGYERRSTYLLAKLQNFDVRKVIVLGADAGKDHEWRMQSDDFFRRRGLSISDIGDDEEVEIFRILRDEIPRFENVRVLIDYSSMPRKWINGIVNYFKLCETHRGVEAFFSYTPGRHVGRSELPSYPDSDYQVASVESLATLEGAAIRQRQTLAIVGLGFEWIAPFAACELIEPDEVRCFYGEPGSVPEYGQEALRVNAMFLEEFSRDDRPLPIPVNSVESVYRNLGELAAPALVDRNVSLIPLGPKTHILGCILISNRLRELTCVYVKGGRALPQQVEAVCDGEVVVTRVHFSAGQSRELIDEEDELLDKFRRQSEIAAASR
ncbi:hypothetical protein [Luteimonas sp. A478]